MKNVKSFDILDKASIIAKEAIMKEEDENIFKAINALIDSNYAMDSNYYLKLGYEILEEF